MSSFGSSIMGGISGAITGASVGGIWGAVAGFGVGVVGTSGMFGSDVSNLLTGGQYGAAKKMKAATKAQNQAATEAANLQKIINRRSMVQQIRSARIKYASALNQASATEGVVTSGAEGAMSSIGSQVSSNLNFMQTQEDSLNKIQTLQNQAAAFQQKAKDSVSKWSQYTNWAKTGVQGYTKYASSQLTPSVDTTTGISSVQYLYNGNNLLQTLGGAYSGIQ